MTAGYAPGAQGPVHRHNAQVVAYVLEGWVVMRAQDGAPAALCPGQAFHEGPDGVHVAGRDASTTGPAKFLAAFAKDKGAPALESVR